MNFFLKHFLFFTFLSFWNLCVYAQDTYPELEIIKKFYITKNKKDLSEIKQIKEIIRKKQSDLEFNYQLGKLFIDISKPLDAEIILKKLYSEHPKDKYEIAYGQALLAQQKANEIFYVVSLNGLSDALKAQKYFLHAHAYFLLQNFEKSLILVDKALELEKKIPYFFILKARVLAGLNQTDDALKLIEDIVNHHENHLGDALIEELNLLKAEIHTRSQNYAKALEIYNYLIEQNKNNFAAYSGRAMIYLLLGNIEEAYQDGILLMTKDPRNIFAPYIVASAYNIRGLYEDALSIYQGRNSSYFLPGLLLHAEASFNAKKYDDALLLINKYLKQDFENPKALRLRGVLKLKENNPHDAYGDIKNAYKLSKDDPTIILALAHVYYALGKYETSEILYQKLEDDFLQFKEISYIAFKLVCKFKKTQENNPQLCADLVQQEIAQQAFTSLQLMYIGYHDKALEEIEKLIKIYPHNITILKPYARILKSNNDINKAVHILFKVIKTDPNDKEALSALHSIYTSGQSSENIINRMNELFENNKKSVVAGYYLANFYYKNKNYSKALAITKEMIKRNTTEFKIAEIYEMIFKIIINKLDFFAKDIKYYLNEYKNLDEKNPLLIRLLRQNIIQSNFKEIIFTDLDIPLGEKTAKDYQVYAEYLSFLNATQAAKIVYESAIHKFPDNFELFNSAFGFYKNPAELIALKNKFMNNNQDYQNFFQAKILLAQNNKPQAIALLQENFTKNYNGLFADLLLSVNPSPNIIKLIKDNTSKIKEYTYEASYQLAKILYAQSDLSDALNLLLPFENIKKNNLNYKILLAQTSFYANYPMSKRIIKELIQEYPHRDDFWIEYIAYEVKEKNYKNAIYLYEKNKPDINKYPNIRFFYAYALLHAGKEKEKQGLKILNEMVKSKQEFHEKYNASTLLDKNK